MTSLFKKKVKSESLVTNVFKYKWPTDSHNNFQKKEKRKKITDLKEMSTWLFIPKGTFHFVLLFDSIAKRKSNSKINLRWQYVALTNETIKSYWQV